MCTHISTCPNPDGVSKSQHEQFIHDREMEQHRSVRISIIGKINSERIQPRGSLSGSPFTLECSVITSVILRVFRTRDNIAI